jgi:hypothetical protein
VFNAFRLYTLDDGQTYLLMDLSVNAKSELYATIRMWATVFVFVYPLGIPVLYLVSWSPRKHKCPLGTVQLPLDATGRRTMYQRRGECLCFAVVTRRRWQLLPEKVK